LRFAGDINLVSVMAVAGLLEARDKARRPTRMTVEDVQAMQTAGDDARPVSADAQLFIELWRRRAMPDEYRWSGRRHTQWRLVVHPSGLLEVKLSREAMPANSKSFDGLECSFWGLDKRDVLWEAGLQTQRVVRWCPEVVAAVKRLVNKKPLSFVDNTART